MRRIRIGIDVGGTFTKAIAIDAINSQIVGKITVPTTHDSTIGVSEGIVNALRILNSEYKIEKEEIEMISHSTTQAVNALLEGDTAKVGIIGMGVDMEKHNIRKRTNIKDVELTPSKKLQTCFRFLDTSKYLSEIEIKSIISSLKEDGAEVLIVSEAFGVDDPSNERFVMDQSDIPSTAGHEVTGIYGLEIRTLTAAINASILPKAIHTAKYVETAIRKENIFAPLMIMKGDGGVTDMNTFKNKPIITILSGPAASVAGALLYLKVIDGIFMEVGGTSTNISIIKNGKPEIKYVSIMNHPTCIRSLDVRVAGVAGGSLIRIHNNKIIDIGPRSAHIAGLKYSCFAEPKDLEGSRIITFKPKKDDPEDYVAIINPKGEKFAVTTTCAANSLNIIPEDDYAYANKESAKIAISILSKRLSTSTEKCAEMILDLASKKIIRIIEPMVKEYGLRKDNLTIVGGGGGASVLVFHTSRKINAKSKIPENSEVISSIGVATAMIFEEKEITIDNPKPDDIAKLAEEVKKLAMEHGALPESITIQSEYINDRSILRVNAIGNANLDNSQTNSKRINDKEALLLAKEFFRTDDKITKVEQINNYFIFICERTKRKLLFKNKHYAILVLDIQGRIRLSIENCKVLDGNPKTVLEEIEYLLGISYDKRGYKEKKNDTDLAPQIQLIDGTRILDFSSLTSPEHVSKAIRNEFEKMNIEKVMAVIKL